MSLSFKKHPITYLLPAIILLFIFGKAASSAAVILFESHPFAAAKSEIAICPDVSICSENKDGATLCKNNFEYLDLNWRISYRFMHDRLTQVLLFTECNPVDRTLLLRSLSADFHLAALKSGSKVLDLIRLSSKEKGDEYRKTVDRFERHGLARSNLVYVFFEKRGLNRRALKAKNVSDLMIKMSVLTRELDVWIEEGDRRKRIVLSFAMPRAAMQLKPRLEKLEKTGDNEAEEKVRTYTPPGR